MNNCKPRILIVDDDLQVGLKLQEIFKPLGYHVQILEGIGEVLLERAKEAAIQFCPHIAVVDLDLLDEHGHDTSGLKLLASLRSARCILYSNYLTHQLTLEMKRLYPTITWVSKKSSPQLLVNEVEHAALENCACRRGCSLQGPASGVMPAIVSALLEDHGDVPPAIVDDVLCQLFPDNSEIWLDSIGGEVVMPDKVSWGRSAVLKVFPDALEPVVVKLCPARRIAREEANYRQYVRKRLRGHFYAQLERTVEFWQLGGVVYTIVGSPLHHLSSFKKYYQNETDPEFILRPLRHFFSEVWSRHYSQSESARGQSLFEIYDSGLKLTRRLETSNREERRHFAGLSTSLLNPVAWVLKHAGVGLMPDVRTAVTHGDLHGENLFVDREHAWAIDFERTGPGHILRDFVELEYDIVARLTHFPTEDLSLFHEFATVLVDSTELATPLRPTGRIQTEPNLSKALQVITGLRELAYRETRCADIREYFWGLLLDALFVASLVAEDSVRRERTLLLASVICSRLSS